MQSQAGRRWVLSVIGVSVGWWLLTTVAFGPGRGARGFAQNIVGLFVTAVLSIYLYRGANWARWVVGGLSAIGALLGWVIVLGSVAAVGLSWGGRNYAYFGGLSLVDTFAAVVLLLVPTARGYFGAGRAGTTG